MNQKSKTSFDLRNDLLKKKNLTRINSLQKQVESFETQYPNQKQKPAYTNVPQESSAIIQLLQIKEQNAEWLDLPYKLRIAKELKIKSNHFSHSKIIHDEKISNQDLIKAPCQQTSIHQRTNQAQSSCITEKYKSKNNSNTKQFENSDSKLINYFNNSKLLVNSMYYWKKLGKEACSLHQLSINQKMQMKISQNQTFYQNQLSDHRRRSTNFQLYKNNSPFQDEIHEKSNQYAESSKCIKKKQIKIHANKSVTVRQMLQKIKSHKDINLGEPEIEPRKTQQIIVSENRSPFDPFSKKNSRSHYKKFTPYKIEEEKRIQYSLQKLEDIIRRNPEINDVWDQLDIKYLQKPAYCSWVSRNREKIKHKKKIPLTVKPLKLQN